MLINNFAGETDFLSFGLNGFPYSVEEEKLIILECLELQQRLMLVGKINGIIVS